jgi:putative redox protein
MKITLNRVNENYHFELKRTWTYSECDNRSEFGGDDLGASPMELVLMEWRDAAIDMISF